MKKLIVCALALTLLLSACAGGSKYKDGVYTATAQEYDSSGWKDQVTLTISGGKITDVDWNSYDEEGGDKKTLSREGLYDMVAAGAESQWHEQAAHMEQALIKGQDPSKLRLNTDGKTDTVSGVTITVSGFVTLSAEALQQAK